MYLLGVVVDENISRVAWNKRVSKVYDVSFSGLRIEKFSNHSLAVTDMILFVGLMNYPYFCKELYFEYRERYCIGIMHSYDYLVGVRCCKKSLSRECARRSGRFCRSAR